MKAVNDKVKFLSQVEIFSDLNSRELAEIAEDFQWLELPRGSYILRQGQEEHGYFILTEGKVEVFIERANRVPLTLKSFYPGDAFGEIDLFSGKPSTANVLCLENCKALVLEPKLFAYMLVRWPKLHQNFMTLLSERLNQVNIGLWEAKHKEFLRSGLTLNQMKYKYYDLWGNSSTTKEVENQLKELVKTKDHLLLIGERGTGQQMMAWHIHKGQFGEEAPFIVVDGRHLDQQWGDLLFETEENTGDFCLAKGSCLLDIAKGGTLFIRDINLISPRAQLKMVTALKVREGTLRIIGSLIAETEQLSVRLIPQLKKCFVKEYKFKPLRERKRDIPVIAHGLFEKLAHKYNRNVPQLDKEATKLLITHNYRQGNVSELIDIIERAFFLAEGNSIGIDHLFFGPTGDRIGSSVNLLSWGPVRKLIQRGIFPAWFQHISFAFLVFCIIVLLFSPGIKIGNYGLLLVWGLWWPSLAISASSLGRVWCGVCPVSFCMERVQKKIHLNFPVPNLIKKYDYILTTILFLLVFWVEAITDMRSNRIYTALWLIIIVTAASITGIIFTRHTWCRHLCPLGALVGIASISGILEIRADPQICLNKCTTSECYRGNEYIEGCPMFQHAAYLDSNQACKMCFRCVRSCPNDAIKVNLRVPVREVWHLVRVNQGFAIFIGVALAILIPITYFEPFHRVWPWQKWFFWYSLTYWGIAFIAGLLTWLIARPFKTKAASRRIKLVFAFIPMVIAGYLAYQLHFFPGANTILLGFGYYTDGLGNNLFSIPILRVGQALAAFLGFLLTGIAIMMVFLPTERSKTKK